jgi:hypothetical protein
LSRSGAALAAALTVGILGAGCGGSGQEEPPQAAPAGAAGIRQALEARLLAKDLSVRWVVCVDEGYLYRGTPVFRCNVDFGDPHIEAYCAAILDGSLVTQVERPALRCARERTPAGEPRG